MTEQRCCTCFWWADLGPDDRPVLDTENRPVQGWGVCGLAATKGGFVRLRVPSLAAAVDKFGNCEAELHTAPEFGCVQWEKNREA